MTAVAAALFSLIATIDATAACNKACRDAKWEKQRAEAIAFDARHKAFIEEMKSRSKHRAVEHPPACSPNCTPRFPKLRP